MGSTHDVDALRIDRRDDGEVSIVAPLGAVDVATAAQLRQELTEVQYGAASRVVLDLDGVEFLDSFGLGVIVGAHKRARTHDTEFVVVCGRARLRQLFELTGLDGILSVVDDLASVAGTSAHRGGTTDAAEAPRGPHENPSTPPEDPPQQAP